MSAQPYTPEEIDAYRPMPSAASPRRLMATVDDLTSRLDAATRRADEVGKAAEAVLREFDWLVSIGKVVGFESIRNDLRAALRIDAAKEGRHA